MEKIINDIEILHKEILNRKVKIKLLTREEVERDEYFSFLDGFPESYYTVGIKEKNL